MSAALAETDRRLANLIRFGTVAHLDEALALVRVECGDILTDWLPWATLRAGPDRTWHAPEVGEQVMVLAPSGDMTQAGVLPAFYSDANPPPASVKTTHRTQYQDGAFLQYDRAGHHWALDVPAAGSIILHIGATTLLLEDGKATLTTPEFLVDSPQSTFTGNVDIEGSLSVTGSSVTHRGTNIGDTHTHGGIDRGPSNTDPPN